MPVTQLGTGKTQFVGHGASSQSKCSCQWISGPVSSCHRPRLPRRNLKIVSSHPFFCISRNLQKFETSLKAEGAGCPKWHKFWKQKAPGPRLLSPSAPTYCRGPDPTARNSPIQSLDHLADTASEDSCRTPRTCGILKGWTHRIRRQLKPQVMEARPCAPLWVKDPRLLPLNTSGGALASHSFGMGAHTLSLTFAS